MSLIKRTILGAIGERFMSTARVAEVNVVSENFRFIEIESASLKTAVWRPGDKIQIDTGDWTMRTYTPMSLMPEFGRLGFLAYLHGQGPGSRWAARLRAGDQVRFFGPRPSLGLANPDGPFVIFGDETAIAAATTLKRHIQPRNAAKFVFEASVPDEVRAVTEDLGLQNVDVVAKGEDGVVSEQIVLSVVNAIKSFPDSQVILAGRAQSIQQMKTRLKDHALPSSRIVTKAYWSEGKVGLD